jgi:hypothetical protein
MPDSTSADAFALFRDGSGSQLPARPRSRSVIRNGLNPLDCSPDYSVGVVKVPPSGR